MMISIKLNGKSSVGASRPLLIHELHPAEADLIRALYIQLALQPSQRGIQLDDVVSLKLILTLR